MSGPAHLSDPTVQHLSQLLDELAKGYLQIPRFQRDFVWKDEQRIQLLQSIREGIPIGSILVWRTGLTDLKSIQAIGPHRLPVPSPSPTSSRTYLLDGLQRLSTLYGCLRALPANVDPFVVDDEGKEISWRVGFDLVEERFVILDRDEVAKPTWLPLSRLLDSVQLLQFQRGLTGESSDALTQRADALAETFRNYKLPVVPIVTEDLATATRTFERVNRQGTTMSELNMVRALTWTESFDLEERLAAVQEKLVEVGWESLEQEWILKTCKAALGVDIAVEKPDEASRLLTKRPEVIDAGSANLFLVAHWLARTCGVRSPKTVPYRQQIVMLAEVMRIARPSGAPDDVISRRLARWFWHTTYTQRFSGITGGQTNAMLEGLRRFAKGDAYAITGKERDPSFTLPTHFNPNWVRVKMIALRLAALGPRDTGGPVDAAQQLADHGPSALVPIDPSMKGIAARIFVARDGMLREELLRDATRVAPEILTSHAIPAEAAQALSKRDVAGFLELRGQEIRRLEEEFYESTQTPIEEPFELSPQ